jgi:subfamily B ATP-binding cassette protein MsbA
MTRLLWIIARPYLPSLATVLLLGLVGAGLEAVGHSLILPLIQTFVADGGGALPWGSGQVMSFYESALSGYEPAERLRLVAFLLVGVFFLKHVILYGSDALTAWTWGRISRSLRERVWERAVNLPYRFFLDRKHGGLVHNLFHEPHHASTVIQLLVRLTTGLFSIAALVLLLLAISWQLTLAAAAATILMWSVVTLASKWARNIGRDRIDIEQRALGLVSETVSGIRQVKVFSAEPTVVTNFRNIMREYLVNRFKHDVLSSLPLHVTNLVAIMVLGGFLVFFSYFAASDLKGVLPLLGTFVVVFRNCVPHLTAVSDTWVRLQGLLPSVQLIGDMLIGDGGDVGVRRPVSVARHELGQLSEGIRCEGVNFGYPERAEVLREISLAIPKGRITAIVGPSGAGKSTLIDLLVQLFEPTEGRILVDGVPLGEIDLNSWLDRIGFVSQDTYIFHGTIRENITFSKPEATQEEIERAASAANADTFIRELPRGYDTVVGDRGLKLSGGQRQRIAIARAMVRNPEILILDEATSALDQESELLVQAAVEKISRDRTVIVVAHRLSTIRGASQIVVMDGGFVVEVGTHESLMAKRGRYYQLYAGSPAVSPGDELALAARNFETGE